MLQKEFEKLTGLTVTAEEYERIDAIYMAAGDINKDDFCEEWRDKKLGESRVIEELHSALNFARNGFESKKMAKELLKRGLKWNAEAGRFEEVQSYEAIQTLEDAIEATGMTMPDTDGLPADVVAMLKLRIICAALNGLSDDDVEANKWPEFTTSEYRWYPWLVLYTQSEIDRMDKEERRSKALLLWGGSANHGANCGLACVISYTAFSDSNAVCGARLALKSEELSDYAGKQFTELWAQFYLGRDDFRRDEVK